MIIALLVGIWSGSVLVSGFDPLIAFLRTFDRYFVGAFTGEGNAEVLLFTFLLGGTIGLVQKSGGAQGLANELKRFMGKGDIVGGTSKRWCRGTIREISAICMVVEIEKQGSSWNQSIFMMARALRISVR